MRCACGATRCRAHGAKAHDSSSSCAVVTGFARASSSWCLHLLGHGLPCLIGACFGFVTLALTTMRGIYLLRVGVGVGVHWRGLCTYGT